jgi:hypothetical protein
VWRRWRPFFQHLPAFIDLETRLLKVFEHALGELLPRIVRGVLPEQPAEQLTASRDCETNRESELDTSNYRFWGALSGKGQRPDGFRLRS